MPWFVFVGAQMLAWLLRAARVALRAVLSGRAANLVGSAGVAQGILGGFWLMFTYVTRLSFFILFLAGWGYA